MNDAITIQSLSDLELLIKRAERLMVGLNNLGLFVSSGLRYNIDSLALREYAQKYGLQIHEPTIGTESYWIRVNVGAGCVLILSSLPITAKDAMDLNFV